jgi:DNA-binding transcriptional ArsR family regulator
MLNNTAAIDQVFHALAEPARRVIVERLSLGSASVSALAEPLDMTLAAVVQHVQSLEQSGLIWTEKIGRVRMCHIEPRALSVAEQWIAARRDLWERRLDRLGQILQEGSTRARRRKVRKAAK